jgi:hypothetical protein
MRIYAGKFPKGVKPADRLVIKGVEIELVLNPKTANLSTSTFPSRCSGSPTKYQIR